MDLLQRLLSPEYWAARDPGPPGGAAAAVYAILALGFAVTAVWAIWQQRGSRHEPPATRGLRLLLACVASFGLVVVAARFLRVAGLSARVWPLACLLLTVGFTAAFRWQASNLPRWLADAVAVLTFRPPGDPSPDIRWTAAGLLVHCLGLASLLGLAGWSPWLAPLALAVLLAPQGIWMLVTGRRALRLAPLVPLFLAYAAGGGVWLHAAVNLSPTAWEGLAFPDPWRAALHAGGVTLAVGAWAWAAQGTLAWGERAMGIGIALLLGLVLAWGSATYLGQHTQGASGSDPYAYVQMAVDLAERGTPLHRFPLFASVAAPSRVGANHRLAWHPLVPVGYNLPLNAAGDAASVWPVGFSALLAGAYALRGEPMLYLVAPGLALLAALATAWLAVEALDREPPTVRWGTGALAAFLVLTSPEFLDRALVPMADGAAALFTTLALIFALRIARRGGWRPATLAGAALGAAYAVRYTQAVLALPVGLAAWASRRERARPPWMVSLTLAAGAALALALPDVIYRWQTFGSPMATGSTELPLLGLENVGRALRAVLPHIWAAGEWGTLLPFAVLGAWGLAKQRRAAMILGSALLAVLGVNLLYAALRLRDLISIFPLLDVATAYGAVYLLGTTAAWTADTCRLGSAALRLTLVGGLFLAFGLRSTSVLAQVSKPGWASFGYVTEAQRAAFEELREIVPEDGVVGASLGAGAVHLYSGREMCRPAAWSPDDLETFLALMHSQSRTVYLLDDGEAMPDLVRRLGARARALVALNLPRFRPDGSPAGGMATLYQVTR